MIIKTHHCDRCTEAVKEPTRIGFDERGLGTFRRIIELCAECNQEFLAFLHYDNERKKTK